jgi:glycosyltransferase involved in cell wall biosynthesis
MATSKNGEIGQLFSADELLDSPPGTPVADISVIICAYTLDRWDDLKRAVESVRDQTVKPREVIVVVDNNPELLAKANNELELVAVVPNHHGPGLSGARSTGVDDARGSIVAFLDDDGLARPRWLEEHLAGFSDANVLGVGGDVYPLWRSEAPRWIPKELYWVVGCTYTGLPVTPAEIRNPIGANMSIRADVLAGAGGFRQELGRQDGPSKRVTGSAEETEFCIRASSRYPDGRWMYQPTASIDHVVTPNRTTWRYFANRCRLEGVSKAVLVGLRGQRAGLATERRYATHVLPRAFLRELSGAIRGDAAGIQRAAAIIAGLGITAFAYFWARAEIAFGRGRQHSS